MSKPMTARQVQCLLIYLGYDPGPVDGVAGEKTARALRLFQSSHGLTADGSAGEQTGRALREAVAQEEPPKAENRGLPQPGSDGFYHIPKNADIHLSENFSSREFRCGLGSPCSACSETVIDPKLVALLQSLRRRFGAPLTITSGYRCPAYNSRIGGASGSRHTMGQAADFVIEGIPPRLAAAAAEELGAGGIGLYESPADGYFVHADTRPNKSFWQGQSQQPLRSFR